MRFSGQEYYCQPTNKIMFAFVIRLTAVWEATVSQTACDAVLHIKPKIKNQNDSCSTPSSAEGSAPAAGKLRVLYLDGFAKVPSL